MAILLNLVKGAINEEVVKVLDIATAYSVFCPGFQKGRVPSEKGIFSAVNGPTKGHH